MNDVILNETITILPPNSTMYLEKRQYYPKSCTNCGRYGHDCKKCRDPTTSWGIILVDVRPHDNVINYKTLSKTNNDIEINSKSDYNNIESYMRDIKFLLVSRKHSLGYIEFLRGRYKPSNIEGIMFMFKQMMKHEIKNIGMYEFDELWDTFWGDFSKKQYYHDEFMMSKEKFNKLKNKLGVDLDLAFYVNNVKPDYEIPVWVLPKARNKRGENDRDCAIREFCEETRLNKEDIKIISTVKPIVEDILGTNGKRYRHVYYLAEMIGNVSPSIDKSDHCQSSEIGDIGFYTYNQSMTLIRDYHIEKRSILTSLFYFYMNALLKNTICECSDDTFDNVHNKEYEVTYVDDIVVEQDMICSPIVEKSDNEIIAVDSNEFVWTSDFSEMNI
jgi:ADP-ribose pyrophosphatase YjhB (NUDIX family)